MKIAYVRWHDASQWEADKPNEPVTHALAELHEIGFYLGENDEVVTIGMETENDSDTVQPGRWRLNIPKAMIKEIHIKDLGKAFPLRGEKKRGAK